MKNNLGLIAENDIFDNSLAATEENKKIRKNIFNKFIKGKINRFPYKNIIKNNFDKNFNNIDKGIYVEFSKHCYKDKYNDIYKYLNDDTYIPPRYSNNMNKDKKNLAKKRTLFRKKAKKIFSLKIMVYIINIIKII